MHNSLQISFRNLERSSAVEDKIRGRAVKLERYFSGILSCDVVVSLLHKHHHQGNRYHVRVDVGVPDGELVASREPDENHAYTDVYVAMRDAFDTMERLLENHVRRVRREATIHEPPPHGRITG
jgi:ribosomal subunit interface protein